MSNQFTPDRLRDLDLVRRQTTIAVAAGNLAGSYEGVGYGYLPPEFIAERENTWVSRTGRSVWLGCTDEGIPNAASAQQMYESDRATMHPLEGYLSVFGQMAGLASNVLSVGMVTYGDRFFDDVGGFDGVVARLQHLMQRDRSRWAVRPAAHSDRTKEQQAYAAIEDVGRIAAAARIQLPESTVFCTHGSAATGCAYCSGVGKVAELLTTNSLVRSVAADNVAHVFGQGPQAEAMTERVLDGRARMLARIGGSFQFGRTSYVTNGLPVMVLERTGGPNDEHDRAADTGLLINLAVGEVRDSGKADAYRLDAAGAALLIRRVFREYELPADLLIASLVAETAAVRAALASKDASGDHTADPRRIAIGVRGGTIQKALADIARLERR